MAPPDAFLHTGVERLDAALSGGLPKAALTEIHGTETRDAGAVAGFALSLVSLILKQRSRACRSCGSAPSEIFREAGFPYARGLHALFGIEPEQLLFSEAPRLVDALWVAEEAARMTALAAVILEIRGSPQRLDLTATRRLHARAQDAGRPVFLLRQAGRGRTDGSTRPPRRVVGAGSTAPARSPGRSPARSAVPPSPSPSARAAPPCLDNSHWSGTPMNAHSRKDGPGRTDREFCRCGFRISPRKGSCGSVWGGPGVPGRRITCRHPPCDQPSRQEHAAHRGPRRAG